MHFNPLKQVPAPKLGSQEGKAAYAMILSILRFLTFEGTALSMVRMACAVRPLPGLLKNSAISAMKELLVPFDAAKNRSGT